MPNSNEFNMAADIVKKLKTKPTDNEMLSLYGFYKQATVGDNNNSEPGFLDFKGKSKHKAWLDNKNMSKYNSEVNYITLVNKLIQNYGVNN